MFTYSRRNKRARLVIVSTEHFLTGVGHVEKTVVVLGEKKNWNIVDCAVQRLITLLSAYFIVTIDFCHGSRHGRNALVVDQKVERLIRIQLHAIAEKEANEGDEHRSRIDQRTE